MALRYLKLGVPNNPNEEIPIPVTTIDTKKRTQLRIFVFSELNFLIISEMITKNVGKRIIIPIYPIMNAEVLSNINENIIKLKENEGAAHIEKFFSFLKKGKKR